MKAGIICCNFSKRPEQRTKSNNILYTYDDQNKEYEAQTKKAPNLTVLQGSAR